MPNQIENFLLGLKFDNEQFERGAAQSIGTLEKLKDALALKGSDKGIADIQSALGRISFATITSGINTVTQSFSLLEQIGIGAARAIGAQLEQLGSKMVRKLGIEQLTSGWKKYNDITQSIQTIMAALPEKSIEEVTERMEKLNWFSDETSYSLTDMTNNISKFVSSGIDLDDAVDQMMGIGNAAAMAGSGVQNASHAMSGFSKAMAAGYMSTINWSWIQTAKLDTLAFKQALIDAAVEVGTLRKVGDAYYTVAKGTQVSAENMREGLSEKWLNTAAMEKALSVYGKFSSKLNELYVLTGDGSYYTTSELLKYINAFKEGTLSLEELNKISKITGVSVEDLTDQFKELSSSTYDTGRKAFAAAQEAITLSQAWEALSDAISTGWMKTFQLIFGNYEEAKVLWTDLANWLYDLFAESGNVRNALLEDWHFSEIGGYEDFISGLNNIMESITSLRDILKEVFGDFIPEITVDNLTSITGKFLSFTQSINDSFTKVKQFLSDFKNRSGVAASSALTRFQEAVLSRGTFSGSVRTQIDDYIKPYKVSEIVETVASDVEETVDVWQENYRRMRQREADAKALSNRINSFYQNLFSEEGSKDIAKVIKDTPTKPLVTNALDSYKHLVRVKEFYDSLYEGTNEVYDATSRADKLAEFDEDKKVKRVQEFYKEIYENANSNYGEVKEIEEPPKKNLITQALDKFNSFKRVSEFYDEIYSKSASDLGKVKDNDDPPSKGLVTNALDRYKRIMSFYMELENNHASPELLDAVSGKDFKSLKEPKDLASNIEEQARKYLLAQTFYKQLYEEQEASRAKTKQGIRNDKNSQLGSVYDEEYLIADKSYSEQRKRTINFWEQLYDLLDGVSTVVRVARKSFEELWKSLKLIFEPGKILLDDTVNLFGAIGRRLSKIGDDLIKNNKIAAFFGSLTNTASGPIKTIIDYIHRFLEALTNLIDPDIESTTSDFMSTISELFKGIWGGIKVIVETFAPMVSSLIGFLKELFTGLTGVLKDFFGEGVNFNEFTARLKSMLDVGIVAGIFGLIKKINDIAKQFKGRGIKDIIDELINGGDDSKKEDKKGLFGDIGTKISDIGSTIKKFTESISSSISKFTNTKLLTEFANSILKIAAAMLIIALIPPDKFGRAAATIIGITAAIAGLTYLFSTMDFSQAKSIAAIGTAIAGVGTGLLMISAAMVIIALIPSNKIDQGLHVITVGLIELTAVLGVLANMDARKMLAAGLSVVMLSAAIDLLAVGLIAMAFIPVKQIDKVFKILTIALIEMTGVLFVLGSMDPVKIMAAAAGMVLMAAALDIMAIGLIALSLLPGDSIGNGIVGIVFAIATIATALGLLATGDPIGLIAAAAAMLIVAPAIVVFAVALGILAFIPFLGLAGGLAILVVSLLAIVAVAYAVSPVVPALLALAAAFVAIGAGTVLLGAGLIGISVALGLVVGIITLGVVTIINALRDLILAIKGTVQDSTTEAEEGGEALSNSLLEGLERAFGDAIDGVVDNLVSGLRDSLGRAWSKIKQIGANIWNWLKGGLEKEAGIASPSKEMAKEMRYIVAGMGLGADKNEHAIKDIGSNMAQTLLDASDETFTGYEPTLTPVLDMSQARSGSLSFGATLTPGAARNLAAVSADIRDQRDSMNEYITSAVNSAINGMRDQLTFVVPLEVDGRQFAQSTAKFTRSELNIMDRNNLRKGGLL